MKRPTALQWHSSQPREAPWVTEPQVSHIPPLVPVLWWKHPSKKLEVRNNSNQNLFLQCKHLPCCTSQLLNTWRCSASTGCIWARQKLPGGVVIAHGPASVLTLRIVSVLGIKLYLAAVWKQSWERDQKCGSFLFHVSALSVGLSTCMVLALLFLVQVLRSAVLRSLRMGKSGSDPFLVSAPVHTGDPSTNLKPRKNSLSEFKHSQQPQTGICMSVQLNSVLYTSSTSSRCWCLKRAQVGKNEFPGEVPFLLHDHLSQGCEVTKSGNYIPHTLVYENLGAEEAHHLNCSWGHLILILLSGSL